MVAGYVFRRWAQRPICLGQCCFLYVIAFNFSSLDQLQHTLTYILFQTLCLFFKDLFKLIQLIGGDTSQLPQLSFKVVSCICNPLTGFRTFRRGGQNTNGNTGNQSGQSPYNYFLRAHDYKI